MYSHISQLKQNDGLIWQINENSLTVLIILHTPMSNEEANLW
jgi:hypothetical protein